MWRYYALRPYPWQDPAELSAFLRIAFKAEKVGEANGTSYWKIQRQYNGQWESSLRGKFPPFEGVAFLEEIPAF